MAGNEGERAYWFPAKRYGWGWGAPRTWQGWVVLAVFALLVAAGVVFQRQLGTLLFMAYTGRVLAQGRAATVALGQQVRHPRA